MLVGDQSQSFAMLHCNGSCIDSFLSIMSLLDPKLIRANLVWARRPLGSPRGLKDARPHCHEQMFSNRSSVFEGH